MEVFSTLEIHFLFFTPPGGAEKNMNEFREGTYTPQGGTEQSTPLRGVNYRRYNADNRTR
jgi:hypothetical protein